MNEAESGSVAVAAVVGRFGGLPPRRVVVAVVVVDGGCFLGLVDGLDGIVACLWMDG